MIASKGINDVHTVGCQYLPESVCVEIRFITPAAARQKKSEELLYITNNNGNIEFTRQGGNPKTTTFLGGTFSLQTNALSAVQQNQLQPTGIVPISIVGGPLININNQVMPLSSIQSATTLPLATGSGMAVPNLNTSGIPAVNSIGIQCKLDEELYEPDIEWPPLEQNLTDNQENIQTQKQDFLKFVIENSTHYKNYKECLICGEICKTNKYFYEHMEMHRGPQTLCCKCGKYLENEQLLLKHNCRKDQLLEKSHLQCPYYNCNVVAISRLELYDHINEHSNDRMYKCTGCNTFFCTGQEFLRHLLIRAKCYTNAKRKLFRVYGLKSPKDRLCRVRVFTLHTRERRTIMVKSFLSQRVSKQGVCKICLKSFVNKSIYNHHRKICVAQFRQRLLRKRRAAAAKS